MARESVCAALVVLLFAGSAAAVMPEEVAASPGLTLQAALDRSGFSPGEIDGRLGAVTKRALAAFQREHRLTPTGAIDDKSWAALGVKPGETGEDDHAVLDRRRPRVAWIALECLWSAAGYWSL